MRCGALAFGLAPGEPAINQIVQVLLAGAQTLLHVAEPDLKGELARSAGSGNAHPPSTSLPLTSCVR